MITTAFSLDQTSRPRVGKSGSLGTGKGSTWGKESGAILSAPDPFFPFILSAPDPFFPLTPFPPFPLPSDIGS